MKVHTVMSTSILSVAPDTTVRKLWKILFSRHGNAVPVIDANHKLVGIITEEDLLKLLYPDYQEYFADMASVEDFEEMEGKIRELGDLRACDIMRKHVVYTRDDTPILRALSRMIIRGLSQLPVLSEKDEVIGILRKGDIFNALVKRQIKKENTRKKRF